MLKNIQFAALSEGLHENKELLKQFAGDLSVKGQETSLADLPASYRRMDREALDLLHLPNNPTLAIDTANLLKTIHSTTALHESLLTILDGYFRIQYDEASYENLEDKGLEALLTSYMFNPDLSNLIQKHCSIESETPLNPAPAAKPPNYLPVIEISFEPGRVKITEVNEDSHPPPTPSSEVTTNKEPEAESEINPDDDELSDDDINDMYAALGYTPEEGDEDNDDGDDLIDLTQIDFNEETGEPILPGSRNNEESEEIKAPEINNDDSKDINDSKTNPPNGTKYIPSKQDRIDFLRAQIGLYDDLSRELNRDEKALRSLLQKLLEELEKN
jgi:hypothetical protein